MQTPRALRNALVIGAVALVPFLGACGGNDNKAASSSGTTAAAGKTTAEATDQVSVKDFAFGPKSITVKVGTSVTWTNKDDFDHSIQINSIDLTGPKFGPQTMPVTFMHQFDKAGTYPYICGVHNSMTGTVIVTS